MAKANAVIENGQQQVYSGKDRKGSISKSSGSFIAYSASGKKIGRFCNRR